VWGKTFKKIEEKEKKRRRRRRKDNKRHKKCLCFLYYDIVQGSKTSQKLTSSS
jgi:hypothetical protein